ncbi:thioredoxin domain-containing protein [bacterium]|nr:thioredoxin domain-containing protein [bacterium]
MGLLLLVTSVLGLFNALYLTGLHFLGSQTCAVSGCSAVLSSSFSQIMGVPVALLGLSYFSAIVYLVYRLIQFPDDESANRKSLHWIILLSIPSTLVCVGLVLVQAILIKSFCPFCLANSGFVILVLGITFVLWRRVTADSIIKRPDFGASFNGIVVAMIVPVVWFVSYAILTDLSGSAGGANRTAGVIGGEKISLRVLDQDIRSDLFKLEKQIFSARKQALAMRILDAEAFRRKTSRDGLVFQEVESIARVSEQEVESFYKMNVRQLPKGTTKEEVERKIEQHLLQAKQKVLYKALVEKLFVVHGVESQIPRPTLVEVAPNPDGSYHKGDLSAPVTIIKFADYQCGYCAKTNLEIKALLKRYPDKIRVVFRHFPLDGHPYSREAAYAAECAGKQGRFWKMTDKIFNKQSILDGGVVDKMARDLDLTMPAFRSCLKDSKIHAKVAADLEAGEYVGIRSTPSLIINGEFFVGLPDADVISQIIENAER